MKIVVLKKRAALFFAAAAAAMALLCVLLSATGAFAVFMGGTVRKLPIYSVETEEKKIAISFDCAWGTEHTDEILDVLERENVRATFFMVEFWAEKYPEYVKKIDEKGHEIGTHSSTHSYMSKLSEAQIRDELTTSSEAIESVTGKKVELFRPPYGDYDDLLIQTSRDMGLYPIQWDVDSLDWKDLSASDIALRVTGRAKSGSIILCHNGAKYTADALDTLIEGLQGEGYEIVPVSQLILRKDYHMDHEGRQIPDET